MKALDPRLLEEAPSARLWLAVVVASGVVSSALAIAAAWILSQVLADAVQHGRSLAALMPMLVLVAVLALARGLAMWLSECAGHAAARKVIRGLRARLLRSLAEKGPAMMAQQRSGAVVLAATTGLDALDVYFARYLPQLVLAAVIP